MKKYLLPLVIVLSLFSVTIQAQNLLLNPSFETWNTGKPTVWSVTSATYISQNTTLFTAGISSCRIDNTTTASSFNITQSVAVTPGKTYTFKVSYYVEQGDGSDARISSYFRNASNVAIKMSVEDSLVLKGPGGNSAYFPSLPGQWNTYSCDVVAPVGASTFLFYVKTAGYCIVSWDNFSFSENTTPTLYSNQTALSGFTYLTGSGPSAEQSFTVKGNVLTAPIAITAPDGYEIYLLSGTSFSGTNSLSISPTAKQVSTLPIFVRLKAGLAASNYNGAITISTTGGTSKTINLTGFVGAPPVVITPSVTTLTGFTYPEGNGPSAQKSFTVSGSGLTSGMTIAAPTDFEISALTGTAFIGSASLTLAQSGGVIPTSTFYVRMKSGRVKGSYAGNITIASSGTTKTISLSGTVTQVPGITISTTSLTGFSYYLGAGPSAEQSVLVSGAGLTTFLTVTPPADFQISTESGAAFAPTTQILLSPASGNVAETPIYVRLKSGLGVNSYSEVLTFASTGYLSKTVSLKGNVLLSTALESAANNEVKAFATADGIIVDGTISGETVSVYNVIGMQLKSIQSKGERITIPAKSGSVYLVQTAHKILKVVL
jgi:hypothetical protein